MKYMIEDCVNSYYFNLYIIDIIYTRIASNCVYVMGKSTNYQDKDFYLSKHNDIEEAKEELKIWIDKLNQTDVVNSSHIQPQ